MEDFAITLTPAMMGIVPAVAVLLQVIKNIESLAKLKTWFPIFSIVLAAAFAYLTKMENPIMSAVIIGLVASGGYDVFKIGAAKK